MYVLTIDMQPDDMSTSSVLVGPRKTTPWIDTCESRLTTIVAQVRALQHRQAYSNERSRNDYNASSEIPTSHFNIRLPLTIIMFTVIQISFVLSSYFAIETSHKTAESSNVLVASTSSLISADAGNSAVHYTVSYATSTGLGCISQMKAYMGCW